MPLCSRRWLAVLLSSGWLACSCQQPSYTYQKPTQAQPVARPAPQLLFLSFHLQQADSGRLRLQLLRSSTVAGHAKALPAPHGPSPQLLVSQLDAQRQLLGSTLLSHPLVEEVEYLTVQAHFTRRTVRRTEAEFTVRMALHPHTRRIQVEEVGASRKTVLLDFPFPTP